MKNVESIEIGYGEALQFGVSQGTYYKESEQLTERTEMALVELLQQAASESETPNTSIEGKAANLIERQAAQIEGMRQQLAATIAACKLKDEALQNCEGMLDELRDYPITHDAIIEALAIQPDDSALKAWLGEPVSYLYKHYSAFGDGVFWSHRPNHQGVAALETKELYHPKGLK